MMGSGNQQQVVAAQPFETGIARMRLQGELSLGQPATQGLGINAKQTATVGQRQEGHGATPARVAFDKDDSRSANSRESSWEYSCKSGRAPSLTTSREGAWATRR